MALQLLPSFQSFLASARAPAPLRFARSPLRGHRVYQSNAQGYSSYPSSPEAYHPASRMYQLAELTAREYERALQSPLSMGSSASSGGSSPREDPEDSEASSDEERLLAAAKSSPSKTSSSSSSSSSAAMPFRNKKKYLKEKQRCEIVRRVRAGEKQAHLAKEFGVSRAAVCYLLKHQTEILSRSDSHAHAATAV